MTSFDKFTCEITYLPKYSLFLKIMGKILPRSVKFVDFQIKNDSKLVRWVKQYPMIYDKKNLLFLNRKVQRRIWEYIAKNLQSTAQECEERWITLLDIYEKCKNGTSLTMHDVLYEQLDELLNSIPEVATYNVGKYMLNALSPISEERGEIIENMLNYDCSQIFEQNACSAISEELDIVFPVIAKEDLENTFDLLDEACFSELLDVAHFSELLDEACSFPLSQTGKGL